MQALTLCADKSAQPVLIHCTHGKDRTGVLAALLLHICGASKETIAVEYALSDRRGSATHVSNARRLRPLHEGSKILHCCNALARPSPIARTNAHRITSSRARSWGCSLEGRAEMLRAMPPKLQVEYASHATQNLASLLSMYTLFTRTPPYRELTRHFILCIHNPLVA